MTAPFIEIVSIPPAPANRLADHSIYFLGSLIIRFPLPLPLPLPRIVH